MINNEKSSISSSENSVINSNSNPDVDFYFNKEVKWKAEIEKLRMIVLDSPLTEELKWGVPCYTFENSNVVLIHVFKEYCAYLFVKGALLHDARGILVQQTANVQAGRQIRFTNVSDIDDKEDVLKAYIKEAIEIEKSGQTVALKKNTDFVIPEELQSKFDGNPALEPAFRALTPGRQRAYILFFSAPKQAKTRESRIEKYEEKILGGKGLDD